MLGLIGYTLGRSTAQTRRPVILSWRDIVPVQARWSSVAIEQHGETGGRTAHPENGALLTGEAWATSGPSQVRLDASDRTHRKALHSMSCGLGATPRLMQPGIGPARGPLTWPIARGRMALRAVSSAPVGSAVKGPRSQLVHHPSLGTGSRQGTEVLAFPAESLV